MKIYAAYDLDKEIYFQVEKNEDTLKLVDWISCKLFNEEPYEFISRWQSGLPRNEDYYSHDENGVSMGVVVSKDRVHIIIKGLNKRKMIDEIKHHVFGGKEIVESGFMDFREMREIKYKYEKFNVTVRIPKEIELFMEAANIDEKDVIDKGFWKMQAEDSVYFSHTHFPNEKGWMSNDIEEEALSKSRDLIVLIHGLYLNTKKILELDSNKFEKKEPLTSSSCNVKGGLRIYFSFYD